MHLSIIIITYQRPDELNGVLENLLQQQRLPEEIVVIDNDPQGTGRQAELAAHALVKYHCPGENLGIPAGRNLGAARSHGDMLVFIDDDARFASPVALQTVIDTFADAEIIGAAFQVRNATTLEITPKEYPGYSTAGWDEPHDVTYFVGCGFAMRRAVFTELGGFDETIFYDGEELELAFRLLGAGWRIRYEPAVVVHHRVSPHGRKQTKTSRWLVRNRIYVGVKHLRFPFCISYVVLWGVFAFLKAMRDGDLGGYLHGARALWKDGLLKSACQYRRHHPMPWATVKYLWKHKGRLLY